MRLGILLLTFDRYGYAQRTLSALQEHLAYPFPVTLHIADDGSPAGYVDGLVQLASLPWKHTENVTVQATVSGRGYGASYNLGTQQLHQQSDVILPLEDDWELLRDWNPDDLIPCLGYTIGCIRLGYLGWTQRLTGSLVHMADQHLLLFDPETPERHVAAGHPRLETVEWARRVGPWPEGKEWNPGQVEFEWCGRPAARAGVAWPLSIRPGSLFAHIGSIQARGDQR